MTPDPNPVTWTPVPCMLCGADDPRPRVVDTVRAGSAVYRFNVVQCRACGFEYVTPRGSGAVFGNLAGGAARRDAAVANAPFYRTGVARLRAAGLPDGGRILDLGCARGDFLAFAAERGFAVTGVDLNPALADAARARGFAVVTGDLRAVASEVGRGFDAVTLWDVIEHVDDPVAVLAACRDVVRPGAGLLPHRQRLVPDPEGPLAVPPSARRGSLSHPLPARVALQPAHGGGGAAPGGAGAGSGVLRGHDALPRGVEAAGHARRQRGRPGIGRAGGPLLTNAMGAIGRRAG